MLSRLAGNAYWMSRYLERAENTSRLLSASNALSLAPEAASDRQRPWRVVVAAATAPHRFAADFGPAAADSLAGHLLIDRDNPSCVVMCLRAVRENARSIRHVLTSEAWEAINATWLEAREVDAAALNARGLDHWLAWSRQRCQWIKGALDDQLRDPLHAVLISGQALERGDFSARLLLAGLPSLLAYETVVPGTPIHREWEALLSAAGMLDAYYRTSSRALDPAQAIELLMRCPFSQRSIASNAVRLGAALRQMGDPVASESTTTISAFVTALEAKPSNTLPTAAGEALAAFNAAGASLQREYFMPSDR